MYVCGYFIIHVCSPFFIQFKSITIPQVGLIFMTGPGVYALLAPVAGFIADKVRKK